MNRIKNVKILYLGKVLIFLTIDVTKQLLTSGTFNLLHCTL